MSWAIMETLHKDGVVKVVGYYGLHTEHDYGIWCSFDDIEAYAPYRFDRRKDAEERVVDTLEGGGPIEDRVVPFEELELEIMKAAMK